MSTDSHRDALLDALDEGLAGVRRLFQHPERRRRFLAELGAPVELATVRTLFVIGCGGLAEPSVTDVAEGLDVDRSTASRLVNQAVAAGYVSGAPSAADRRRLVLTLTPEGRALLARAREVRRRFLERVTADWPDQDVDRLGALLARLRRGVDAEPGEGPR